MIGCGNPDAGDDGAGVVAVERGGLADIAGVDPPGEEHHMPVVGCSIERRLQQIPDVAALAARPGGLDDGKPVPRGRQRTAANLAGTLRVFVLNDAPL